MPPFICCNLMQKCWFLCKKLFDQALLIWSVPFDMINLRAFTKLKLSRVNTKVDSERLVPNLWTHGLFTRFARFLAEILKCLLPSSLFIDLFYVYMDIHWGALIVSLRLAANLCLLDWLVRPCSPCLKSRGFIRIQWLLQPGRVTPYYTWERIFTPYHSQR